MYVEPPAAIVPVVQVPIIFLWLWITALTTQVCLITILRQASWYVSSEAIINLEIQSL